MKVLHIIAGSLDGGAAKGAMLLHKALLKKGVMSQVLTNAEVPETSKEIETTRKGPLGTFKSRLFRVIDQAPKLIYRSKNQDIFSTGLVGFDLWKFESFKSADIIHLHWINTGLVSMRHLPKFGKPTIWTLRDMWPMTGGCHYALECEHYQSQCGRCPQLESNLDCDLSRLVFNNKKKYFPPTMELVATSNWISQCASQSALLRGHKISTIHNGIDTNQFSPVPKAHAKAELGIPESTKVLLFGAQYIDDKYKGFDLLLRAVPRLQCPNILILLFGRFTHSEPGKMDFPHKCVGFVRAVDQLRLLYAAADVYAAPSIAEAFGKTTVEAQACGTPVVCFDDYGQKDIVEHMRSGYRAKKLDIADLAFGIDWVIENEDRHKTLCLEARARAVEIFDISVIADKYFEVYKSVYKARGS
jgi:glycosyltransferase involved in cell wall biosynthesis